MLSFTDTARERIRHFLTLQQGQGVSALRVAGNRAEHKLWLVRPDDKQASDRTFDGGGFEVFIDPRSADALDGATVDFVEGVMQSGFRISYPSPAWDDPVLQRVQEVLDYDINPGIASHGGSVTIERLEGDTLYLSMGGGCQGCASAQLTLRSGVESRVRAAAPEIRRIVDVTDHAAGENPYYTSQGESPVGS
jgi:Fe/S biogenesis protein NfuA